MLVQFFLTILEAHCDIGGSFGPPKKIEVITEPLALIETGHSAEHPVLALKGNRSVLEGRSLLARRVARLLAN
jgi:hypothetical protein